MITASRYGGNREARLFELSSFIPPPGSSDAVWSGSMREPALAIAAVSCAVKLTSETLASFVMRTYSGDASERKPVLYTRQAELFQFPAEGWTSFDMWSDVQASIELNRDAFLWKVLVRGQVEEIYPIDPDYVEVKRLRSGQKVIRGMVEGQLRDITRNVVHIRGWSPVAAAQGISTADQHRRPLRTMKSLDEYRGRYLDNDGAPGIYLELNGNPDKQQRQDIVTAWAARHAGAMNAGKVGVVWGGHKVNQLAPTLRDSQAADLAEGVARDVARMFRIYPVELLHATIRTPETPEAMSDKFYRFSLMSRGRRIARALAADPDIFPDRRALYPGWDISEFLRGDIATTADVIHSLVQVGILTKNEGRAMFGLPPVPDGDQFIVIPVGGGGPMGGPSANGKPAADAVPVPEI